MTRLSLLAATILAVAAPSANAQSEFPKQPRTAPRSDSPIVQKGPCFDAAVASVPDGSGHDHNQVEQHRFSCRMRQVFFDSLKDELAAEPDVSLGEADVENDIAAVAVAYPESGALFFDVSDPANPKFLSWYRGEKCDGAVVDVDCGAYVDLSEDGKVAFLSQQNNLFAPADAPDPGQAPIGPPGVEIIDLRDPTAPQLTMVYLLSPGPGLGDDPAGIGTPLPAPLRSGGGVHTANSMVIPPTGGEGPREPGEYLFSMHNARGIDISKVERPGGIPIVRPVTLIDIDETHDTYISNDPITGRTYMYVAAGNSSGFYVYDVTAPSAPVLLAEWDLQPNCEKAWYSHTIDVAFRGNRRYVVMPVETFYFGAQSQEDQAAGCGEIYGNGDKPGPMWIVDASDFSKLGPADASDGAADPPELGVNSRRALVATWTHAANAAGGNLEFTPHNQQVVGDKIYLSAYHAGVIVVNAAAAFAGRNERPYEEAFVVPHGPETREYAALDRQPAAPFFSAFAKARSSVWDMLHYKGHTLAFDQFGGIYSFREDPAAPGGPIGSDGRGDASACTDRQAPRTRSVRARLTRRSFHVTGRTADRGCSRKVSRVSVAIGRTLDRRGRRCRFLTSRGRFGRTRACSRPQYLAAKGTVRWRVSGRARLPRGRYVVLARGIDAAGNVARPTRGRSRVR